MKRILHISDLHFGRTHSPALESLQQFLSKQDKKFDLVIVTGDWTQRARSSQFRLAADFVQSLMVPIVSVPGNHDLPLYNFLARLLSPLKNYRKFIQPLTLDHYIDEELVVVGIRTATARRTVEGRILSKDITRVQSLFSQAPQGALRVIACHHPLYEKKNRSKVTPSNHVDLLLGCRPDIVLSGHSHLLGMDLLENTQGHKTLHLSAGSTLSNRLRGEVNSFHVLEIDSLKVKLETYHLDAEGFRVNPQAEIQNFSFSDSDR